MVFSPSKSNGLDLDVPLQVIRPKILDLIKCGSAPERMPIFYPKDFFSPWIFLEFLYTGKETSQWLLGE